MGDHSNDSWKVLGFPWVKMQMNWSWKLGRQWSDPGSVERGERERGKALGGHRRFHQG